MPASRSPIALSAATLGLAALLGLLIAGFGTRVGWWDFRTGFALLRWSAWMGLAAAALGLGACFHVAASPARRGLALGAVALVCGVIAFAIPYSARDNARKHPRINDITTDFANPPAFVAILPLRAKAPDPAAYGGARVARQQKAAYPDIRPLIANLSREALFKAARETAAALGWRIVAADAAAGRIEATDRTLWFGFTDDIVIRVSAAPAGMARLDIRSKSRVGRNDAGTNARRVRRFLDRLRARVGTVPSDGVAARAASHAPP